MALPFHPHDAAFNRENALYLAHAASIAYNRSPAAAAMDRLGLVAVGFRHRVTRTRGFLGVCDTHAVLAFRGSEPVTLPNWVTDVVVKLVERREYVGRVHQGFSSVLEQTWDRIVELLKLAEGKPLFLAGHSMGGALAVLAACRLAKLGRPAVATYTYGAPRIGDRAFCAGYKLPTYRVVNGLDLIPEIPLASVKRLLPPRVKFTHENTLNRLKKAAARVPCYGHTKTLVYIDLDGQISINPDIEPWPAYAVTRALATRGKSFMEGITDHLIGNYIRKLEPSPAERVNLTTESQRTQRRIKPSINADGRR